MNYRNLLLYLFISVLTLTASAQSEIVGDWNGVLEVQGMKLRLVFHISETDEGLKTTLDSPDQGAKDIPVAQTNYTDGVLKLTITALSASYEGELNDTDELDGNFMQAGFSFPIVLSKDAMAESVVNRPQEPKEPLPYKAEDVKFASKTADIRLAGTLTLPEGNGPFPAAILISGSGPQDRDETFMTHKPFLVLADHLTRNGIAVLRYDDRGFGESTGDHNAATSLDFAEDVEGAIKYLSARKEIDKKNIGLIGHSEGGLIAPIVATSTKKVAFIVLMAGPGVNGVEIQKQQIEALSPYMGLSNEALIDAQTNYDEIAAVVNDNEVGEELANALTAFFDKKVSEEDELQGAAKEQFIEQQVNNINRAWYKYFINHEPAKYLKQVKCPILAINGTKDVQVVAENLDFIQEAASANKILVIKKYEGMNHLFQVSNTGLTSEYAQIEETMSPTVLNDISNWILEMN